MICLLQRVTQSSVTVAGKVIGAIDRGLMVLIAVERGDTEAADCAESGGTVQRADTRTDEPNQRSEHGTDG